MCSVLRKISLIPLVGALLLMAWFVPGTAKARKPSLRRCIKDIGYKKVIKCKFTSRGKFTKKLFTLYYTRSIECKFRGGVKGRPKIKKMTDGYVSYIKRGRRFYFSSWNFWTSWYTGLKAPKNDVVVKLVKANKLSFLGRRYDHGYIVSDLTNVKVAKKPKYSWSKPNQVRVSVVGNYRWKKGSYEVEDVQHLKWVSLVRDKIDSPWKYSGTSKTRSQSDRKVLSTKKLSKQVYNNLKSIRETAERDSAKAHMSALPKVKVPIFKTGKELVEYTHKMLRTATPKQLESFLRQVYSPWHFVSGSTVVMHSQAEKSMKTAIASALSGPSKFKDQYCVMPFKKPQDRASYYNKTKSSWSRIATIPGGPVKWVEGKKAYTTYKLSTLRISILSGSSLARMKSYSKDKCPKQLTVTQKSLKVAKVQGSGFWRIGDKVWCAYKKKRLYYEAVISNIKGKQILVQYTNKTWEWTKSKYLKSQPY
jgi:hypothetical protein